MRKINISILRAYIAPLFVGVLSGVVVFLGFYRYPMLPGLIFGVISATFFYFKFKAKFQDLFIWTLLSWLSFFFAFSFGIQYSFAEHSGDVNSAFGVGGSIGIVILILAFRVSFYRLNLKDVAILIVIATYIPILLAEILNPTTDPTGHGPAIRFWLPLFVCWQTFVLLYFTHVINKRLTPSELKDGSLPITSGSLLFQTKSTTKSDTGVVHVHIPILPVLHISNMTLIKIVYGAVFTFLNLAFFGGMVLYYGPYSGKFMEVVMWVIFNLAFIQALVVVGVPGVRMRKFRLLLPIVCCIFAYILYLF